VDDEEPTIEFDIEKFGNHKEGHLTISLPRGWDWEARDPEVGFIYIDLYGPDMDDDEEEDDDE